MRVSSTPVAAAAALAICSAASAAPRQQDVVPPGGFVSACAAPTTNGGGLVPGSDVTAHFASGNCQSAFFAGTATVGAAASSSGPAYSNSASGSAGLGHLHLKAANQSPNSQFFAQSGVNAGWADRLTPTLPGAPGQSGFLIVDIAVDGSFAASGFAGATAVQLTGYKNGLELQRGNPGFSAGNSDPISTDRQRVQWGLATFGNPPTAQRTVVDLVKLSVPVTVGQGFDLGIYALALAGQRSVSGVAGSSSGSLDFTQTIRWAGVEGILIGGTLVKDGLSIQSASGIDWMLAAPVPEAPPAALFAAGLALLALRRLRRG